jgi:hypothetical protein
VIIVVSEETGTISVVMLGVMQRALTPESLRQLLKNELGAALPRREVKLRLSAKG